MTDAPDMDATGKLTRPEAIFKPFAPDTRPDAFIVAQDKAPASISEAQDKAPEKTADVPEIAPLNVANPDTLKEDVSVIPPAKDTGGVNAHGPALTFKPALNAAVPLLVNAPVLVRPPTVRTGAIVHIP